jgi:hypothetical protein
MADLGNQKIKNTYQFVLQADGSGNVQKLDGNTPSLIFNSPITYNVGTLQSGYVLKSDGSGGVSWGAVSFSGDVYISGGSIVGDTIELKPSSGGTLSIPGLSFSANSNGTIGNAPRNKNVGIGTPTPNAPLTVIGGISATTFLSTSIINALTIQGSEFNSTSDTGYKINTNKSLWVDGGDTQVGNTSLDTDILGTTINLHSITSGGTMNLSQKLGVSGKTFLGTIDAAGDSYTNDKILVAQSNGEVEYLTTAQLKADIGDEDYWTASTTGGHIINSGLTTSNVGIGTPTPNEKLTVVGDISGTTVLRIGSTTAHLKVQSQYIRYVESPRIFFSSVPNATPNRLYDDWRLNDSDHLYFGTGNDLDIYHNGSQSYVDNNTGTLNILSSAVKLGDTTSEVTVQDNLVVGDDLTVNTDNLYVHSTNQKVGIKTLNPDALLTVSGNSSTGFTAYNLNGGQAQFVGGNTRVLFANGADTTGLSPGDQIQVVDGAGDTYIVSINLVNDSQNIFLTANFPGDSVNATAFNYNGAATFAKLFKVYDGVNPSFQVSGNTVMSGTTDLLDIFSRIGMSGTVTSVAISGTDGIDVDSGSPITDSGTITLGLSNIDATKIANGTVTNTEFQYINTLSSNAQTQINARLPLAGGTMTGDLSLGGNQINELAEPALTNDAATKGYVDTQVGATDYWSATTTGGHIVNSGLTGNVGIGTDTPSALLDVQGTIKTNTSFVVGNATLTTSELDISSGNFTLDVEGDITLDANGADIILSDNGTDFGRFKRDTSDFVIKSETNNKDIVFKGQDGGGTITALTLDMSEAGKATFNSNVVSANEDVYMFSNRGQGQTDNTHWYGPNYQGIYNYSWSKDYGDDTEVLTLNEEYANAGLLVPYDCILTGFFTIGHTNSGTVGYSCGLWYVLQTDLASSLNVTSGTAGDVTLTPGVSGTTVNPGNGKNPLTIDKRGTVSIALTVGSMIYPRVGDSAVVTDTTWNIYLKRT